MLRLLKVKTKREKNFMPINKKLFLIIFIFNFALANSGLTSLKICPAVREAAMANTGVASAQGPQAIYFNPATIGFYQNFLASLYYAKWFSDMHHQSLFVTRPTKIFNIGVGIVNFSYGKVEYRDTKPTDEPIDYFIPQDYSLFLTLSRALDSRTAIGVSGKFYYQKILDKTASSGGIDVGLKLDVMPKLSLGFSIINFGGTLRYLREKFWLPTEAKAGANLKFDLGTTGSSLIGAIDCSYLPYDKRLHLGIGAEFALNNFLFLQGGFRPFSETNKFSTGLGFKLKSFRIEYSFSPYTYDLGITHRFALGFGY
uniref:PorV/PorQ family protein n=1 Tax=candidate division WOR-3 bacterium TaxID=2052148 RepID=A0A7C6EAM8_UNCW3